jgi:hypothetical protein
VVLEEHAGRSAGVVAVAAARLQELADAIGQASPTDAPLEPASRGADVVREEFESDTGQVQVDVVEVDARLAGGVGDPA